MENVLKDALFDALRALPYLLGVYILIEYVELKFGSLFKHKLQQIGHWAPIFGAILGALPQCGFSVIATTFYLTGYVSIGTLLSVYVATSDEALPLLLSHPDKAKFVIPLILFKIIYAAIIGLSIDYLIPYFKQKHEITSHDIECCGHHKSFSFHPLIHTLKLFGYILIINLILGILLKFYHPANFFGPFVSAIIGLIPNCAASVALTELFLKNTISFGTLFAGLCSSAGLGLLVLIKDNDDYIDSFRILIYLLIISVIGGYIINWL